MKGVYKSFVIASVSFTAASVILNRYELIDILMGCERSVSTGEDTVELTKNYMKAMVSMKAVTYGLIPLNLCIAKSAIERIEGNHSSVLGVIALGAVCTTCASAVLLHSDSKDSKDLVVTVAPVVINSAASMSAIYLAAQLASKVVNGRSPS